MRVLVTGGTGFLGANLVAGLNERRITPLVLHRSSSQMKALEGLAYKPLVGDILDPVDRLAEMMDGCKWVFHTAAVSDYWRQDRDWLYRVNVEGTKGMLAAALRAGVKRFVFTSSAGALGVSQNGTLLDETSQFNLEPDRWPYAHSKQLAEAAVHEAVDDGLDTVIVNPTVVLGARDVNQISGAIIVEVARGRLRFCAPGGTNFVAVEDVVAGHIAAAERGRPGERYILGGENLSYCQAVSIISKVIGRPPPLFSLPRWILPPTRIGVSIVQRFLGRRLPMDATQVWMMGQFLYVDTGKATNEFDLDTTPLRVAVQRTYDWYNNNGYLS